MGRLAFMLLAVLATAGTAGAGSPGETPDGKYLDAIWQELVRLDIDAQCDSAQGKCTYTRTLARDRAPFTVVIRLSRATNTVYIYIDRFIPLPAGTAPSCSLSSRLLELNREMVTARFEWDKTTSSIRLSSVQNTDSNFDRKAFRSQIVGLHDVAKRLGPTLWPKPQTD